MLLRLIEELRRRKVCRALTLYAVGLWLITQIVDLAYQHLGLPDWTLRFVMVLGLVGLPIALLLSWLLDLTPNGLVRESADSAGGSRETGSRNTTGGRTIDCCLLLAALAISANLVWATMAAPASISGLDYERIAVDPFKAGFGADAPMLSAGLTSELQHELAGRAKFRVVAPREPFAVRNCLTLTGSVSTDDNVLRVTFALVDNETMEVVRTAVVERDRSGSLTTAAALATDIVAILDLPGHGDHDGGTRNDS